MNEIIAIAAIFSGILFFIAGSIGLIRLPDLFSRLHALAKADNLGLAFVSVGLIFIETEATNIIKIILIWLLIMASSAVTAHLVSRHALQQGDQDD